MAHYTNDRTLHEYIKMALTFKGYTSVRPVNRFRN